MSTKIPSIPSHIADSVVKDSPLKARVSKMQEDIAKFDDPLAGLTALFLGLSPEEAKAAGIY